MTDEELIEQSSTLPPVYVDGFGAYRKVNGVLRCVGFIFEGGAQLNLVVSLAGADVAQAETRRVLREKQGRTLNVWSGSRLAH